MLRPGLLVALFVTLCACEKERNTGVPPVGLDISINVNLPEYAALQVPGGWVYLTGGSQGLIVYRHSNDQFTALDRHCPYQSANLCRVTVENTNVTARDTACCTTQFLLFDGGVVDGPAPTGLQRYNTNWNGTILRIYN